MASQYVGVCYGNNWSPPDHVISLHNYMNIKKMRIYKPNQDVMKLLVGSDIVVILGVPDEDIERLAHIPDAAQNWVHDNVLPYIKNVSCIAVGNGVKPADQAARSVLPAMENINGALISFGLKNKVKVSTVIDSTILGGFQLPSQAEFRDDALIYIEPIINFLVETGAPLLANVHPYSAYVNHPIRFSLQFALFIPGEIIPDGELEYKNLFDFLLDGIYFAVEKLPVADTQSLKIVVSESGWPYAGGRDANILSATIYNKNLNGHVNDGTPKRPQPPGIETYLSDENGNVGPFNPDGQAQEP